MLILFFVARVLFLTFKKLYQSLQKIMKLLLVLVGCMLIILKKKSIFLFLFLVYHILESMQFDACNCLPYYKMAYFEMYHGGSLHKAKKCFRCY